MATSIKKKDDEFSFILLGCGVFSLALFIIDIFAAKWGVMNFWIIFIIVVLHAATAFSWVQIVRHWKDPNKDYWRKIVLATSIAAILVIMGHRAGWIENKMFEQDVEKAKTSQL
jgi:amino acid transporter